MPQNEPEPRIDEKRQFCRVLFPGLEGSATTRHSEKHFMNLVMFFGIHGPGREETISALFHPAVPDSVMLCIVSSWQRDQTIRTLQTGPSGGSGQRSRLPYTAG